MIRQRFLATREHIVENFASQLLRFHCKLSLELHRKFQIKALKNLWLKLEIFLVEDLNIFIDDFFILYLIISDIMLLTAFRRVVKWNESFIERFENIDEFTNEWGKSSTLEKSKIKIRTQISRVIGQSNWSLFVCAWLTALLCKILHDLILRSLLTVHWLIRTVFKRQLTFFWSLGHLKLRVWNKIESV